MTPTIASGLAFLLAIFTLIYVLDRGAANSLERIAIALLRMARRLRERRAAIEAAQREALRNAM
jgi:hypothetical protein